MPRESLTLACMADPGSSEDSLRYDIAAWLIAGLALVFVLKAQLLPGLLAGLLVHELVYFIAPRLYLGRRRDNKRKLAAVALVSTVVVLLLTALLLGVGAFFRSEAGSLHVLLQKMALILEGSMAMLPDWMREYLPEDADGVKEATVDWLREHAGEVRLAGKEVGLAFVHILIGMIIGAMVSLREAAVAHATRPLARALAQRAARLGKAFRNVVFAQVRIAALNALFTGIYLLAVLPMFGVHLPLKKTMIALTFIVGLLPVVGNLISNAVIVVVSLSHSPHAALGSLAFLVALHKGEYFLNARIVGARIRAGAWELLLAMLLMEAAFGIAGLVAAPIYYAYLKDELAARGLV
jgi:predicted PurR-regulated permease PerM